MNENCEDVKRQIYKKKILLLIYQFIVLVSFLTIWELLSRYDVINSFLFSSPTAVFKQLKLYLSQNELLRHVKISVLETFLGIIIGSVLGVLIASILWYFEIINNISKPFLNVLNALPKTALAPIIIIWAGSGMSGIVVVSISILLIITIMSTINFYLNIDEEKIKMLKSFNASKLQIFYKLVFPNNIGNLCSVVKINIGLAWVGVIVGEFLVSREGIGYLIMYGSQVFKLDLVMMGVFVLAVCAFIMHFAVEQIEKLFIKGRE